MQLASYSSLVFSGPDYCGSGYERMGKWAVNTVNNSLTFFLSSRRVYGKEEIKTIKEIEIYEIRRMSADQLILIKIQTGKENLLSFIKRE